MRNEASHLVERRENPGHVSERLSCELASRRRAVSPQKKGPTDRVELGDTVRRPGSLKRRAGELRI